MAHNEHLKDLDAQLAAIAQLGGETIDIPAVRKLVTEEVNRIEKGQAAFQASSPGATCRTWTTVECSTPGGSIRQIRTGPGRRTPVAWGGSHCIQFGNCQYCINYECRTAVSPT
jgi:hypothetical protein